MYAVVAMGGVFAAAAQAPLTSIASVVEMTGNFSLTLPIMLATGIAAALSKRLTYGSIYTTKLLRRGIDIERPKAPDVLQTLTVAEVMQPLVTGDGPSRLEPPQNGDDTTPGSVQGHVRTADRSSDSGRPAAGAVSPTRISSRRCANSSCSAATGLPVLSHDGAQLRGWITRQDVLRALGDRVSRLDARDRARRAGR